MNSLSSPAAETPEEIVTFLMPITGKYLFLPNVTVAEIIHLRAPKQPDDMPNWYLGDIEWRGQKVPMVSFEALNDEPFQTGSRRQNIAVLNGVSDSEKLPFLAVLTQGAPRLLRISAEDIDEISDGRHSGPAELMIATANGEVASIPDMDLIERHIIDLLA